MCVCVYNIGIVIINKGVDGLSPGETYREGKTWQRLRVYAQASMTCENERGRGGGRIVFIQDYNIRAHVYIY